MDDEKKEKRTIFSMYINQLIGNFGTGLASPFIPYYAAALSFTSSQMGILQASSNLFPNIFQYIWGKVSDLIKKRLLFIIVGGFISSFLYILFIFVKSPYIVIGIIIAQSIFSAMVVPAWNSMIGHVSKAEKRASFIGNLSFYSNLSMMMAGLFFIAYAYYYHYNSITVYFIPFYFAGIIGVFASLIMLYAYERNDDYKNPEGLTLKEMLSSDKYFSYFLFAQSFYNFFMAISWPLFYITTVDVLKATFLEIGIINLIGLMFTVPFLRLFGKMIDRFGTKNFMTLSRFIFIPVPLAYGFAHSLNIIYIITAVTGFSTAISNIAFTAYILDSAPPEKRGIYIGLYNSFLGFITFFGSIIGGYAAQFFSTIYGLYYGLLTMYVVSFVGRMSGAFLFLRVKERRKYPGKIVLS